MAESTKSSLMMVEKAAKEIVRSQLLAAIFEVVKIMETVDTNGGKANAATTMRRRCTKWRLEMVDKRERKEEEEEEEKKK